MAEMELFIDDNVVIPDEILKMSKEERRAKIAELEAEARAEKQRILEQHSKETA